MDHNKVGYLKDRRGFVYEVSTLFIEETIKGHKHFLEKNYRLL